MIAHEFANLFPMLSEADMKIFAAKILQDGLQVPITTLDGKILDGRNRYRACELSGVVPVMEEYQGSDPLAFVISHNLDRRHLTESQRGMVAAKMANLKSGNPNLTPWIHGVSQAKAQDILNVGETTVTLAKKIQRIGSPELNASVECGELTVNGAVQVAHLPHEEQAALVAEGPAAVKAKAKEIRQEQSEPDPEPEPLVVDGVSEATADPKRKSPVKVVESEGMRIWLLAKTHLDRISKYDEFREEALRACAEYCTNRINLRK